MRRGRNPAPFFREHGLSPEVRMHGAAAPTPHRCDFLDAACSAGVYREAEGERRWSRFSG
jgi:hypothetical protein